MQDASVGQRRVPARPCPTSPNGTAPSAMIAAPATELTPPPGTDRAPGAWPRAPRFDFDPDVEQPSDPRGRRSAFRVALRLVAALVLAAAPLGGWFSATGALGATGGTDGDGLPARIAVGGARSAPRPEATARPELARLGTSSPERQSPADADTAADAGQRPIAAAPPRAEVELEADPLAEAGPRLTTRYGLRPVAVPSPTPEPAPRAVVRDYTALEGDTLISVAAWFNLDMETIWWANDLAAPEALPTGTVLVIPAVDGLVVTARKGDTLESIGRTHGVGPTRILRANGLTEGRALRVGQVLIVPRAKGEPLPVSGREADKPAPGAPGSSGTRAPAAADGRLLWPVVGGGNRTSQRFGGAHKGLDIAASYGSPVIAAASGQVLFAGWRSNGGGYQVWISHGSGLNTTYNHLAGVSVGGGQHVGAGQRVGSLGSSGRSTGPHLHFEVWRGPVWNGGARVNPGAYL